MAPGYICSHCTQRKTTFADLSDLQYHYVGTSRLLAQVRITMELQTKVSCSCCTYCHKPLYHMRSKYSPLSGLVFVFQRQTVPGITWSYVKFLQPIIGPSTYESFGHAIGASVSTNVLMIGAPCMQNTNPGAVFVYSMSPGGSPSPSCLATLQSPSPSAGDKFGHSIAVGTDAVFIGAPSSGERCFHV